MRLVQSLMVDFFGIEKWTFEGSYLYLQTSYKSYKIYKEILIRSVHVQGLGVLNGKPQGLFLSDRYGSRFFSHQLQVSYCHKNT